ncbi:glycosyltransferase family 25 protein [Actibacterium sp. XHP0104]|uniref:glycosyltransferase family 25 protein n=1 Tax=Actibacterium sp. XHP0104 TaxID=2984335 RepID=UPI0021E936AB|nr:glycosyltransferase family 25 protein [Actibacterium sp. XHP0104]MCV2882984.1 glycosyltransferase family 25 protein [Actibacterium sp. XHP0104]
MTQFSAYLINLDSSTERLNVATAQLDQAGIPFERISAFDGRQLDPLTRPEYDEARACSWFGRKLSGGELGCYFSHVDVARRFLESDARYGLALEDDLTCAPNARAVLDEVMSDLTAGIAPGWHMVNLGRPVKRFFSPIKALNADDAQLCRAHYFPDTTTAILWSRAGAEAFLKAAYPIFMPVDHFLRYWGVQTNAGVGLTQVPFTPSGAESDINTAKKPKDVRRARFYQLRKQRRLYVNKLAAKRHQWAFDRDQGHDATPVAQAAS